MSLIREVTAELHEIISGINQSFADGEFDHLPDPVGERIRLVNQALGQTKLFGHAEKEETK